MIALVITVILLALLGAVLAYRIAERKQDAADAFDPEKHAAEMATAWLRALIERNPVAISKLSDFNVAGWLAVEASRGNPLALKALDVPAVRRSIENRPKLRAILRRGVR